MALCLIHNEIPDTEFLKIKKLEVKVALCLIHNEIPDTEFLKIYFISVKANAKFSLLAILETYLHRKFEVLKRAFKNKTVSTYKKTCQKKKDRI